MSGRPGGVIGAFAFSAFSVSVAATFVLLPQAFAVTWPWVAAIALFGYGPEVRDWLPWVWWIVLALVGLRADAPRAASRLRVDHAGPGARTARPATLDLEPSLRQRHGLRYGSAAFVGEDEVAAPRPLRRKRPDAIYLRDGLGGTAAVVQDPGDGDILLVAGARTGKLTDILAQNICSGVLGGATLLILDVKGELAAISQDQTPDEKYCLTWNPFGLHGLPRHRLNPFSHLKMVKQMALLGHEGRDGGTSGKVRSCPGTILRAECAADRRGARADAGQETRRSDPAGSL